MNADVHLVVKNVIQNENGIMISVNMKMKKIHRVSEADYAKNLNICAFKCEKDCDIGEYLKDCTYKKFC